jgi:ABC-type glycerol-3-phosphate transport system substrate-binding protein
MKSMSIIKMLVCAAALGAAIFALAACGGGGESDDAAVKTALNNELKAYHAADWPAAYQIASPRFRTTCSLDQL